MRADIRDSDGNIRSTIVLCNLEEGDQVICTKTVVRSASDSYGKMMSYEAFKVGQICTVTTSIILSDDGSIINLATDSKGINRYFPADSFKILTAK